jgi:hypothetical protein
MEAAWSPSWEKSTAGPVDIVVTDPGGGSQTVVGGYTYVEPGSYPLDGEWAAFTVDGSDTWIEFTVREHLLTSVPCIDPFDHRLAIELSEPFVNGKVNVTRAKAAFRRGLCRRRKRPARLI